MPRSVAGVLLVLVLALSLMSADARGPGRRLHVDDDGMEFNDAQEVRPGPGRTQRPYARGKRLAKVSSTRGVGLRARPSYFSDPPGGRRVRP